MALANRFAEPARQKMTLESRTVSIQDSPLMNHLQFEGCLNALKLLCRCRLGILFYPLYAKRKYYPTLRMRKPPIPMARDFVSADPVDHTPVGALV